MNSLAEFPCSLLDDSFLPGGVITAQCSANSTWEALDMSQCTFRNDVQVATVAVVEVLTSSAMQEETIEVYLTVLYFSVQMLREPVLADWLHASTSSSS